MTLMYPSDPKIAAPYPAVSNLSQSGGFSMTGDNSAQKACTNYDKEYRVPNMEELYSMFVNKKLLDNSSHDLWSSTTVSSSSGRRGLFVGFSNGEIDDLLLTNTTGLWCVKR